MSRAASSIGDGDEDDDSDEEDDVARLIEALSGLDASERAQRKRRDAWLCVEIKILRCDHIC